MRQNCRRQRSTSEAEVAAGLGVVLQVLGSVVQVNTVLLEEAVERITRLKAQKPSQLTCAQSPASLSLQCQTFQGGPWQIAPPGLELARDFFRQFEGYRRSHNHNIAPRNHYVLAFLGQPFRDQFLAILTAQCGGQGMGIDWCKRIHSFEQSFIQPVLDRRGR